MFTLRYMLLLEALKRTTRLGRLATAAGTAIATAFLALAAARGHR